MSKRIIIISSLIIAGVVGIFFYAYYFFPRPYETWIYISIDVTRKSDNLSLGDIKIEDYKIISNIKDFRIKSFIDKNKNNWENNELTHPIGGQTITGALWDGIKTTTINDKDHLLSIYVILDDEFGNNYNFELNTTREYGTKRGFIK